MMQLLHILIAFTLAFPPGLFEHQACCLEGSGSTCVMNEVDFELLQICSAPVIEPESLFLDAMHPPGCVCPAVLFAPETALLALQIGYPRLLGCRPPPGRPYAC